MGLIQIFVGVMQWGKFIRLVPHPVMLGFVNGLAIVIFLAQLGQFQVPGTAEWLSGTPLMLMLALVAVTMAIIWVWPRVTNVIPAPLAGIGIVAAIVIGFGLDVPRVGDLASIQGGLPTFHIPMVPLNWDTFEIILPYALILSAIGLIESLLTLNLVGEMLLAFILFASGLIEQIPLAALVGVMFMVVIGTFAWNSLRILRKVPRMDAFVTILVTIVTVWTDLATAVVVGVIVSALAYSWNNAKRIYAVKFETDEGAKVYAVQGPLFFGSADGFAELFDVAGDPDLVIVDFENSRVVDQSALQAIEALAGKYEDAGKSIQLQHLSHDCHQLLSKAGHLIVDSDDDPDYEIAVNYSVRTGVLGGH